MSTPTPSFTYKLTADTTCSNPLLSCTRLIRRNSRLFLAPTVPTPEIILFTFPVVGIRGKGLLADSKSFESTLLEQRQLPPSVIPSLNVYTVY